ncbi:MAG: bacterial extracellular solute-binding protein, putative [Osedax symbiont Rs1]|nr:MAG: bacterial extracellular solute-binding protein, putative [Osedax symbiont Rs1]
MMKIFTLKNTLKGSLVSVALAASFASGAERIVNVYNWSDYIDKSMITDFEKETGIKVNYDVFDSNEILETKMLTGSSGYDIVTPSGPFLKRQINAGIFQKLDKSKLPNLKHSWQDIDKITAAYDPDNAYSINYMWGTTGIGYVKSKVEERIKDAPVNSYSLIFDPENAAKLADCGIYVLDAPTETIPAALQYLGLDPNSKDKADIKKAEELFANIRPYIRKFHSSEFISALANGDACLALAWSGDILQARDRAQEVNNGIEVVYSIPKEGAQVWFDQMAIPSDAKNVEEAHIFLNYLLRPEVIAKATNFVNYANGNKASQAFIDKSILEDPAIYPDSETMKTMFTFTADGAKYTRHLNRTWTRIKTGL